jgi:O-antigen ligase
MLAILSFMMIGFACIAGVFSRAWAFALAICIFPIKQVMQASAGFFLQNGEYPNILVALVIMVCITRLVLRRHLDPRAALGNHAIVGTLLIYAYSATTLAWTMSFESGLGFVRTGLIYLGLYVIACPLLIDSLATLRASLRAIMILGSILVILIELNPAFVISSGRLVLRFSDRYGTNPLALGDLGGAMILAGMLFPVQIRVAFLRFISIALGTILAFQSGSRGQILFALLVAFLTFPIARSVRSVFRFLTTGIATTSVLVGALVAASTIWQLDVGARWDQRALEGGTVDRLLNYGEAFAYWASRPAAWIFGLGFNSFSAISSAGWGDYAHNIIVEIVTEAGLPIFALFIMLLFTSARAGFRLFQRVGSDPESRAVVATLIALAMFYFLVANKQANLWGQGPLFMSLCLLHSLNAITTEPIATQPDGSEEPDRTDGHTGAPTLS